MNIGLLVAIISISAALLSFLLGSFIILRNITNKLNFNFCLYAWAITMWSMLSYAFFVVHSNFMLYKYVAAFGSVCLLMIAPWVLYIVKEKPNKILLWIIYILSMFMLTVPLWDKWAMTNFESTANGFTYENGFTVYFYAAIIFITVGYVFYLLLKNLFTTKGAQRNTTALVLTGMTVFILTDLAFGVILPEFHITPLIPYVTIGAAFFVTISTIAIAKYLPVELMANDLELN